MKKLKLMLSIMAVVIAVAGAFVTNASSKSSLDMNNVSRSNVAPCDQEPGVCVSAQGNPQCQVSAGILLYDRSSNCGPIAIGVWHPDDN